MYHVKMLLFFVVFYIKNVKNHIDKKRAWCHNTCNVKQRDLSCRDCGNDFETQHFAEQEDADYVGKENQTYGI